MASVGNPSGEPPGAPKSRQTERKNKTTKKKAQGATATAPAANTYNTTVDTDSLKPQDTATS